MLSGTAAGIGKTAGAPIERVKLLIQNQDEMLKSGRLDKPYNGMIECAKRTHHNEGVMAFWRGNSANVIRYFPTQALNFAFKDKIQGMFNTPKTAPTWKKFGTNITSGGLAGSLSLLGVYSLDYARTRLGNDAAAAKGGKRQFNGLLDVYKQTMKSDGISGLYRGFGISVVGIFIYRGLYFGLYDSCKPIVFKDQKNPSALGTFFLSLGTTSIAGILAYPIDTLRRRMMMRSGESVKYSSSLQAFREISAAEGWQSFKGGWVNTIRGASCALVLVGFDKFTFYYKQFRFGKE